MAELRRQHVLPGRMTWQRGFESWAQQHQYLAHHIHFLGFIHLAPQAERVLAAR